MSIEQKVPKIIKRKIPKLRFIWALVRFFIGRSGLHKMGWFKSAWAEESVNKKGEPIPWITFSAIYFMEQKINKSMRIFEYGSGNSTLWWADKAKSVVAVEHDKFWANRMKKIIPSNCRVIYRELDKGYSKAILEQKSDFDIVFIDGRNRVECAMNSLKKLSTEGVIVWDNTDRDRYSKGVQFLINAGFRKLDFYGIMPIDNKVSLTTIFYREINVLHI